MFGSWTSGSAAGRFGFALVIATIAVALHWLIYPFIGSRVPFLFFLPSIILIAAFAGRGPGLLVSIVGLLNGALLQAPTGSFAVASTGDQFALGAYSLMALVLVGIGDYFRSSASRAETAEERLKRAQDDAGVGVFELDLQNGAILGSAGLWRLLGRPVQSAPAPIADWFGALHPEDVQQVRNLLQSQPQTDARLEYEHRVLLPDGRTRWLLSRMRIEHDPDGRASRARGVAADITERKDSATLLAQTQAQLRQQVADLQELHELSAQLFTIPELEDQLQLILRALARLHGAERGLVSILDPMRNLLTPAASIGFSDWALQQLHHVRGGEGACGMACVEQRRVVIEDTDADPGFAKFRDLARHESFRAVHSTPLLSRTGDILGAISVHFDSKRRPTERELRLADICARKAAVFIERARAEQLAKERDQRFRVVIEASSIPFTILAPVRDDAGSIVDFRWSYLNQAAARVLNRAPQDVTGRCVSEVLPGAWEDSDVFDRYLSVVERNEVAQFEVRSRTNETWFQVVASPLEHGLAIWFADVTSRKRQEEALREADRRKDEFLATLAHELRNPLAPIRQAAMIAGASAASDAQKRWSHSVIERQVHHMSLLLDDLLDVSRITRGSLQLRKQRTDLNSVLSAAVETVRPLIDSKHHQLTIDAPSEPVDLNADPLRLAQILSNLLTNAAKYTNAHGAIHVSAQPVGGELLIRVTDNGIGLARDDLTTIFQMFAQVKSAQERSEGGLGIGLALTKGLVELHGGVIEAASDGAGLGSAFTVRLPVLATSISTSAAAAREARESRLVLSRRILIADDNRDAAESLAMLLRLEGHDVALAHDGESAWRAFHEHRPEVALLDIGMPLLSGYELAQRIREDQDNAEVLLIAITGWGQGGDKARALSAGFDHHMTKPVEFERLLQLLRPARRSGDRSRFGVRT